MEDNKLYSLINKEQYHSFEDGDVIVFDMPSPAQGVFLGKIYIDKKYGPHLREEGNYFYGCYDWDVFNVHDFYCPEWIKTEYEKL